MRQIYFMVLCVLGCAVGSYAQNVGVNNSNPGAALDVKGATGGGPLLNVRDENDVTRLHILSNGNVGIGTASPGSYKLNVNGTGRFAGQLDMSFNKIINVTDPTDPQDVATKNYVDGLDEWSLSGNNLYPKSTSYNVGIGNSSPGSYKLNVTGNTYMSGSLRVSQDNTTGGGLILADDGDFVDMNDGFGTMRFSYGVRINNANSGGTTTIQLPGTNAHDTYFNNGSNFGIGNASPSAKLHVTGNLMVESDGFSYMDNVTSGNWNALYFRSKANSLTEGGFILKQDESANCAGTGAEDVRFSIGVYNDFRQSSAHSDELWFQGGGRLVYNVGTWDSELNTIIGTPSAGTTGGHEWRVNNSAKMTLNHSGDLTLNNLGGSGKRPVYVDNNGTLTKGTGNDNSLWTIAMDMASSPDDLGGSDISFTGGDDDGYYYHNLPFSYTIEGTAYNSITICTNGWVAFGNVSSTSRSSGSLPASFTNNPVIFPYWTDLKDFGSGENVRVYNMGSGSNQVVVVHYKTKAYCGNNANPNPNHYAEFQVMIHQNGGINVKYINMNPTMNGQQISCSTTYNVTIGFQLSGGSSAKSFPVSYNAKVLDDNRMPESWSVSPLK